MVKTEVIKTEKCKFCGKELNKIKNVFNIGNVNVNICTKVERCNCIQAQEYWKIQDYEEKQKEEFKLARERIKTKEKLYQYSKMNIRLRNYTFSNYITTGDNQREYLKVKKYADDISKGNKDSLFITGKVGTGKTHLASSIANYLIEKEIKVIFGTLISLLNEVKDTYTNSNETESYIIEKYSKVPLLIIDDLGKEKPSEWTLEKLFTIINNRYENNLPVVITTNYNRDQLTERLADNKNYIIAESIISRLYEMCRGIYLKGKDKRKELV